MDKVNFCEAIAQQMNSGVIIVDQEYRLAYWNNFVEIHAGKSLGVYRNQNLFDIFPELPVRWLMRKLSGVWQLKTPSFCSWEQRHHLFEFNHTRPITTDSHFMAQNCNFYLITDKDGTEYLCISIEDATDVCHYQSKLQQTLDELAIANRIDGLTKAFNRKHWEECLAKEFSRANRFKHDLGLVMFDLDHFKKLNDTYGHLGGDQVLVETVNTVKSALRLCDIFGRYGGEEFAVILPETDINGATDVAERIRKAIEKVVISYQGEEIKFTASVGVAMLTPTDDKYEQLIARADEALYQAKANGRNRVCARRPEAVCA